MKQPKIELDLTPITEAKLEELGFEKVLEDDSSGFYNYLLRLPKNSVDPNCMCLISSYNNEWKEIGLDEGEYIVELFDSGGLGFCTSVEEIDMLYYVLTKLTIYPSEK
jgi:hypothetical protein